MNVRLIPVAAVVGIVVLAWWLWPSEADRVRARIRTMAHALSSAPGETDLERMTRVATLTSGLAPDVSVDLDDGRRIEGRDAVSGVARQLLLSQQAFGVGTRDVRVQVDAQGTLAAATLVVVVNDESFHDVELGLVKLDHVWLVREARLTRPLARPALSQ
jgi:hypothetical protein